MVKDWQDHALSSNLMQPLNPDILAAMHMWPDVAQQRLLTMRTLFIEVAETADIGPLDESLKWGQPAWRPKRPRTGSTLRLNWTSQAPDKLAAFVDCKTDLAAQMLTRFPESCGNDGRRCLTFPVEGALKTDAVWTLAWLTFTYHRGKRRA